MKGTFKEKETSIIDFLSEFTFHAGASSRKPPAFIVMHPIKGRVLIDEATSMVTYKVNLNEQQLKFKGIPIIFDEYLPEETIHILFE